LPGLDDLVAGEVVAPVADVGAAVADAQVEDVAARVGLVEDNMLSPAALAEFTQAQAV
jgi:hypothetical protein